MALCVDSRFRALGLERSMCGVSRFRVLGFRVLGFRVYL